MRLTNSMRDSILNEEVRMKFDEKLKEAKSKFQSEIKSEVIKITSAEKIPQDLIDRGYVGTSNYVSLKMEGERSFNQHDIGSSYPVRRNDYQIQIQSNSKIEKAWKQYQDLKLEKENFVVN